MHGWDPASRAASPESLMLQLTRNFFLSSCTVYVYNTCIGDWWDMPKWLKIEKLPRKFHFLKRGSHLWIFQQWRFRFPLQGSHKCVIKNLLKDVFQMDFKYYIRLVLHPSFTGDWMSTILTSQRTGRVKNKLPLQSQISRIVLRTLYKLYNELDFLFCDLITICHCSINISLRISWM